MKVERCLELLNKRWENHPVWQTLNDDSKREIAFYAAASVMTRTQFGDNGKMLRQARNLCHSIRKGRGRPAEPRGVYTLHYNPEHLTLKILRELVTDINNDAARPPVWDTYTVNGKAYGLDKWAFRHGYWPITAHKAAMCRYLNTRLVLTRDMFNHTEEAKRKARNAPWNGLYMIEMGRGKYDRVNVICNNPDGTSHIVFPTKADNNTATVSTSRLIKV